MLTAIAWIVIILVLLMIIGHLTELGCNILFWVFALCCLYWAINYVTHDMLHNLIFK